jgi:hypothetical protein
LTGKNETLPELRPFLNLLSNRRADKLFIGKGIITQEEFLQKIAEERPTH